MLVYKNETWKIFRQINIYCYALVITSVIQGFCEICARVTWAEFYFRCGSVSHKLDTDGHEVPRDLSESNLILYSLVNHGNKNPSRQLRLVNPSIPRLWLLIRSEETSHGNNVWRVLTPVIRFWFTRVNT